MALDAAPSRIARPTKSRRNRRVGLSEGGARFVAIAGFKQFSDGYTWFVGFLKLALPTIAVVLVGMVLMWPQIKGAEESLRKTVVGSLKLDEVENLQMVHARYVGTDDQNRPYVLTAAAARQMSSGSDLVALEAPKGDMALQDGNHVSVSAQAGAYYQKAQLLDLFGSVTMTHGGGYVVETAEARINLKNGSAEGNKTVDRPRAGRHLALGRLPHHRQGTDREIHRQGAHGDQFRQRRRQGHGAGHVRAERRRQTVRRHL